jgi:glycosyltransferase involved in cell wall biosynthesis
MKILFVINNFYMKGNGMAASARRTVKYLQDMGHEVRVLAGPNKHAAQPQPEYGLKEFKFPFVQGIIDAQGFSYASSDPKIMEEAIRWADVVHLEEAFVLEIKAIKIARKLGKPLTATYHLHPENITNSLGPLRYWKGFNRTLLRLARNLVFNHCAYVQCPTENVMDRLRRYHFKSNMALISNGLIPDECIRPLEMPEGFEDENRPLKVVYIGRLSKEKDQPTLLQAMRYSSYAKHIQLIFAGIGPDEKRIKRLANKLYKEGVLAYEPQFVFLDRDGLRQLSAQADLCAHCATIEVEGLSIMEAMQQAVVPVIAVGPYSGTSQFALDGRSRFPEKNPEALAQRIDYWLSHPKERWEMGHVYAKEIQKYDIRRSVAALLDMFQKAVDLNKA